MMSNSDAARPNLLFQLVWLGAVLYGISFFGWTAYKIRLHAIENFGKIIHEFDPYFNFRATEYLYEHGWKKFATWFDYKVWYPLGRPVGTTIYPGMQVTSVFIKRYIFGDSMSLNDVCVYVPAWFGVSASAFTGLMAYECSLPQSSGGSLYSFLVGIYRGKISPEPFGASHHNYVSAAQASGVFAMGLMAILPAHLMRSVGGGYDNESVAITAMTLTFWLWCRSLRDEKTAHIFGVATGLAYFYMVAAWGGYVFVLNLIGVHAGVLVLLGRFSTKVYRAYSLFYLVGTTLAIQVPVVGLTPLKSLEQLGPCAVFLGYQLLQYCEIVRKKNHLSRKQAWLLRIKLSIVAAAVAVALVYFVFPDGFFGPFSSRIRGLFVKHTRTGNPLVDSVAEHQPATPDAYFKYVHYLCYTAPVGMVVVLLRLGDASSFLLLYGAVSYFFSSKMVRLILLLAPIASSLSGIVIGRIVAFSWSQLVWFADGEDTVSTELVSVVDVVDKPKKKKNKGGEKNVKTVTPVVEVEEDILPGNKMMKSISKISNSTVGRLVQLSISLALITAAGHYSKEFIKYSWDMSQKLSHPTILYKATYRNGDQIIIDDYRESYTWLKDNTPEDSRILAWWDYGYQISAIANRTTVADGNTWNHEHIALLGRALTSSEKTGHRIARHLADYALVWAGGGGDDLAKSPHLARIANSVYRDMCPNDPTCRGFGYVDQQKRPSKMMRESLMYKLHSHNLVDGVRVDPNRFKEVHSSKHGKVRIFKILAVSKESKEWVADPANRICDAPGSWFCRGQYPPGLNKVLGLKKDFAQLEDFNAKAKDEDYQKAYFEHMSDPEKAKKKARETELKKKKEQKGGKGKTDKPKKAKKRKTSSTWEDTDETSHMWSLIKNTDVDTVELYLEDNPDSAFIRSSDGRGPLWWACEYKRRDIMKLLVKLGVSPNERDKDGLTPRNLFSS